MSQTTYNNSQDRCDAYTPDSKIHKPSVFSVLKTTLLAASVSVLAACGGGGGSEPTPKSDTKAPSVVSVSPDNGAKIAKKPTITVTFSENVKGVNTSNVSLTKSGAAASVALTIGGSGKAYTIKPNVDLEVGASYTLTLKKAIADTAGNKLAADVIKTYTVSTNPDPAPNPGGGGTTDTTAPTISSLSPANNATIGDASNKRPTITVIFSENVANVVDTNVKFKQGTTDLGVTISGSDKTYTITPKADLFPGKPYTLEFKAGIKDAAGNALVAVTKNYTSADFAPKINSTTPANEAKGVALSANIGLNFSKVVTGVTTSNVKISKQANGSNPIGISITGAGVSYILNPDNDLEMNTTYYVVLETANIKDVQNNALVGYDSPISFTTSDIPARVSLSVFAGKDDSLIKVNTSLPPNTKLLSYSNAGCNIANVAACTNGKEVTLSSSINSLTTNALTTSTSGYVRLKTSTSTGKAHLLSALELEPSVYTAAYFKEQFWLADEKGIFYSKDGINWTKKAYPSGLEDRVNSKLVLYNNKLWLIAGCKVTGSGTSTSVSCYNDVWNSEDGLTWQVALTHNSAGSNTQFLPRYLPQVVVANLDGTEKMWLFAGALETRVSGATNSTVTYYDDIWSSTDGITWAKHSAKLPKKIHDYQAVLFKGEIWITGGQDSANNKEKQIHTFNGTAISTKTQTTANPITGHKMFVFKNELWISAGYETISSNGGIVDTKTGNVYRSTDGLTWSSVSQASAFTKRSWHDIVVTGTGNNERLWVFAGDGAKRLVWSSTDGMSWTDKSRPQPKFGAKYSHQIVEGANDTLWFVAGHNGSTRTNDVYKSTDAINWQKVSQSSTASLPKISEHQVVFFNNHLWVLGGRDNTGNPSADIYKSSDGAAWTKITPTGDKFTARYHHRAVVANVNNQGDRIWLVGGFTNTPTSKHLNDTYSSTDGTNWVKHSATIFSTKGVSQHAIAYNNGKIWLTGGINGDGVKGDVKYFNGSSWSTSTPLIGNALPKLYLHDVTFHNNKLWIVGGSDGVNGQNFVANSFSLGTGNGWTKQAEVNRLFKGRWQHQVFSFKGKLWLIGGAAKGGQVFNDIWQLEGEDAGTGKWRKLHKVEIIE